MEREISSSRGKSGDGEALWGARGGGPTSLTREEKRGGAQEEVGTVPSIAHRSRIEMLIANTDGKTDPRRHRRQDVDLSVDFLAADQLERTGRITNISAGGAFIATDYVPEVKDTLALKIEKVGFIRSVVVRLSVEGFGVHFPIKRERSARLADTLTWLLNGGHENDERRGAERFDQHRAAMMTLKGGEKILCQVVDISTDGAQLVMREKPPIGTKVKIGKQAATIIRHTGTGVGLAFASGR